MDKIQEALKLMKDVKIPEDRLEKLDKAIKLFEEAIQPKPEYKDGDWVMYDGCLRVFDRYDYNDDGFCYVRPAKGNETWGRYLSGIKHAKNISNLRLRHDGTDVCPVEDRGAILLIETVGGLTRKTSVAVNINWRVVEYYTIIPDSEEQ